MKTRPVKYLLPDSNDPQVQASLDIYYNTLHEVVSYGTHLMEWSVKQAIQKTGQGPGEIYITAPLLLRHIIELIDAISIQVKAGSISPAKVQLRAILEAYFSLEYLLQQNTEERSSYMLIVDYYRDINSTNELIPGTDRHEAIKRELKSHNYTEDDIDVLKGLNIDELKNNVQTMQEMIDQPRYAKAKKKYLEYTKNNTKRTDIKWYALDGGPETLYKLSLRVKYFQLYQHMYKHFSSPVHASDLWVGTLAKVGDGMGAVVQLRSLLELDKVVKCTNTLGMLTFMTIADKLLHKEKVNISEWIRKFTAFHKTKIDHKLIQVRYDKQL